MKWQFTYGYNIPNRGHSPLSLPCDCFVTLRELRVIKDKAFGKRPFHISCTHPLTPCGASASECNCKSNKYLRKYKENLYNLRFLVEFATNNTYL